jgi:hypothetical protein
MEKYVVVSPGRAASNSLTYHLRNSHKKLGIPYQVDNLEMPITWPEIVPDPENWTVVLSTRKDHLAQVLSFYTIMLTKKTYVSKDQVKDLVIGNFTIPRYVFFTFAYGVIFFHERVDNEIDFSKFKKVHRFIFEDIVKDWHQTGVTLGFDDWSDTTEGHAMGAGRVWDKVINKEQVLSWVAELQKNHTFTVDLNNYS